MSVHSNTSDRQFFGHHTQAAAIGAEYHVDANLGSMCDRCFTLLRSGEYIAI